MTKLKIRIKNDHRTHEGTPLEIIEQMKYLAWNMEDKSTDDYINWMVEQLRKFSGIKMIIKGETIESRAKRLIESLLEHGAANEVTGK